MLLSLVTACALVTDADLRSRMDLDGDGEARPADCDDGDPSVGAAATLFVDADLDGYGGAAELTECAPEAGVSALSGDCDDDDATTFPGAAEACDYEDNDCDGVVDNGVEPPTWYFDGDSDGYGTGATTDASCVAPAGYVAESGDCNDADDSLNPETRWYPDNDGDGYGDTNAPTLSCDAPPDLLRDGTDCDDADPAVNPAGQEVCDDSNTDEDCDGVADNDDPTALPDAFHTFYADSDADGYGDASTVTYACDAPSGYVSDGRDCDDSTVASGIECGWIDVSAGWSAACGLRGSGLAECWGADVDGLLSPPAGAFTAVESSRRANTACGLRTDGTIECWGDVARSPPGGTFQSVEGGAYDFCALGTDSTITCWGDYLYAAPSGSYTDVATAGYAAVALAADGTATSWGSTAYGPIDLPNADYTAVSAGYYWICGLRADGSADCVGDSLPLTLYYTSEESLVNYPGPNAAVVPGHSHVALLDADGAVTIVDDTNSSAWESMPSAAWLKLDFQPDYGCGIEADASIACWGSDYYGEGQTTPPE